MVCCGRRPLIFLALTAASASRDDTAARDHRPHQQYANRRRLHQDTLLPSLTPVSSHDTEKPATTSVPAGFTDAMIRQTFGTLTCVPARLPTVKETLAGFEKHEWAHRGGPSLLGFMVIVDGAMTVEQRTLALHLAQQHPWVTLVLNEDTRTYGQGYSLNLGLAHVRSAGATYWLRWEDSWTVARPFFDDAFVLLNNSNLVDVSIADDDDLAAHLKNSPIESVGNVSFVRRHAAADLPQVLERCADYAVTKGVSFAKPGEDIVAVWPNLSLRPAITRAVLVSDVGNFTNEAMMWPWKFETLYACELMTKHPEAIDKFGQLAEPGSGKRSVTYLSTYDKPVSPFMPFWQNTVLVVKGTSSAFGVIVEDNADGSGVNVVDVKPGTPCANAGLQVGDVIYEINGHPSTTDELNILTSKRSEAGLKAPVNWDVELVAHFSECNATATMPACTRPLSAHAQLTSPGRS